MSDRVFEVQYDESKADITVDKRNQWGEGLAVEKIGDHYFLLDFYDSGAVCQAYDIEEIFDIITEAFNTCICNRGRVNK